MMTWHTLDMSTSPKRLVQDLTLQYPSLITSTAVRTEPQEFPETAESVLISDADPLLQPKKRLPLNMIISAMAQRDKNLLSPTEEMNSIVYKLDNMKENAYNSLQTPNFHGRCKKRRITRQINNNNAEQSQKICHCVSNTMEPAERVLDKYGDPQNDLQKLYESKVKCSLESQEKNDVHYSTPYAKSRFQQLYGNGFKKDFHFSSDESEKNKFYSESGTDVHPLTIFDPSISDANIDSCSLQECQEICIRNPSSELSLREFQPFVTSHDFLQYGDVPLESKHEEHSCSDAHRNFSCMDSMPSSCSDEDSEPTACFKVTYTKKNVIFSKKHIQNNINISESHYQFIFEPKVILEETGESISLPSLLHS